jgi:hypothetical protein
MALILAIFENSEEAIGRATNLANRNQEILYVAPICLDNEHLDMPFANDVDTSKIGICEVWHCVVDEDYYENLNEEGFWTRVAPIDKNIVAVKIVE